VFSKLKERFSEEPILKIYKFAASMHIIVDASNIAIAGVLE
jgi:hypothetical protein